MRRRWSLTPLRRLTFADEIESCAMWIAAGGGSAKDNLRVGNELARLVAHVVNMLRDEAPSPIPDRGRREP